MPSVRPSVSFFSRTVSPTCESALVSCSSFKSLPLTEILSENELSENDEELQHLRISLKAVEVQMPPHPDEELQRCIATFKDDYRELKKKRANRASLTSMASIDTSHAEGSPTR